MTRTEIRAQFAGEHRVEELLNQLLREARFDRLRVLIAFARWSGLHLIDPALRAFAKRAKSVEVIVGVDLGGTTGEALEYLMRLPNTRTWVFRSGIPSIVFHPKAFGFAGPTGWCTVIGSSNATSGGLFTNAELVVRMDGKAQEPNPFDAVWSRLNGSEAPLTKEHVAPLTQTLLDQLSESLDAYTTDPPDRGSRKRGSGVTPVVVAAWPPKPGRPPRPDRPEEPPPPAPPPPPTLAPLPEADVDPDSPPATLYMEVWKETGGGTQVQFGTRVVKDFFGASAGGITWVRLDTPDGNEAHRVQLFKNHTARIPLRFMAGRKRPAVICMTRIAEDHYTVDVRSKGQKDYGPWLARCTEQTRRDSKRYGMFAGGGQE